MLIRVLCTCAGFICLSIAAAPASAADRYATPTGSGTACTQEAPCALPTAIGSAAAGDEVFVYADQGDYRLTSGIQVTVPVHGYLGRPRLIFASGGLRLVAGSAEDLYVQSDSDDTAFALDTSAATATRIVAKSGFTGHACFLEDATLTNSICWGGPAGDYAIELDGSNTLRNVTAVGGTVTAILALGRDRCGCSAVVNSLVNVIARSSARDITAQSWDGVSITVDIEHSSFGTTQEGGDTSKVFINGNATNQAAAPVFVDAANGDFRQAPGSPTIDAGLTDPANGTADVDGDPRAVGLSTDIGADEYVPPFAGVTLSNQTARLKGKVAPVTVGCPAETVVRCEGTLILTWRVGGKSFTAGRGSFEIGAGATAVVSVRVTPRALKALKLLKPGKSLRTSAAAAAEDGAGQTATATATIRLRRG